MKGSRGNALPDSDVAELRDIGLMEDALGKQMSRLKAKRDNILRKQAMVSAELQVTDHAIVRYLERVEGYDVEALKSRVRGYLKETAATGVKGVYLHPQGQQVVVSARGLIVTVLPPGSPIHEVLDDAGANDQP